MTAAVWRNERPTKVWSIASQKWSGFLIVTRYDPSSWILNNFVAFALVIGVESSSSSCSRLKNNSPMRELTILDWWITNSRVSLALSTTDESHIFPCQNTSSTRDREAGSWPNPRCVRRWGVNDIALVETVTCKPLCYWCVCAWLLVQHGSLGRYGRIIGIARSRQHVMMNIWQSSSQILARVWFETEYGDSWCTMYVENE